MFFWIALFIWSLALQYVAAATPSAVDAASGLKAETVQGFEVDGDLKSGDASTNPASVPAALIVSPPMANGDDWLDGATGNGVVDPANPPHSVIISDPINSNSDSQYVGGAKELNTCTWGNDSGPVTGKDDIGHVMAYAKFVGNSAFFYMGAERIVNNGDTHVDFELNRKPFKVFTGGDARPDRSVGDVIISLEYSNGGANPIVIVYKVTAVTSCGNGQTVTVDDITTTAAVRSATNFVDLPSSGFGYTIPQFEFAEASIDLHSLGIDTACPGLSAGSVRTRAGGDVSSSQLKDRVDPFPIDLNNCGKVTIKKDAIPNSAQDFSFSTSNGLAPDFKLDDDSDATLSNTKVITEVAPGTYSVTEASTTGWALTGIDCSGATPTVNLGQGKVTFTVPNNGDVTCTFTNTKLKNNPTISTSADQTGVVVGNTISDSATLAGATASAGGTITFRAYGPNDPSCDKAPAFTSSAVTVNGNGTYGPVSFAAQDVGTYKWIASYSGDADNNPVAGACGDPGETDTTIKASPTISTVASAAITIGGSVSDTATLAGGFNPTGTITYKLYGPNDTSCANPAVFTTTKPVSGNGSYTSAAFTPTLVGTYRWIASYGGDANNNAVSGKCNDANESVVVSPATPGIATSATESVVIGNPIHDTAVLSGAVGPTGTITFNLYATADCSGSPLFSTSAPVNGNGSYGPVAFTPAAIGTYKWIASYSGDGNNSPIAGACNDAGENDVVIKASPAIATSANESVVVGNEIHDTALLSGGVSPTGTITFTAYSDAQCTVSVFTTDVTVNGNASYGPVSFTPGSVGTYHWIASYGGDAKNNPIAGKCGDTGENDTVTAATTTIVTSANESVVIGSDVHDTAVLGGGVSPTGKITFTAYSDAQCTVSVFSTDVTVNGNGSYGPVGFTPAAVGTYHWIASYSGDGNNAAIAGACGDAGENDTVIKASPAISTSANESVVIGTAIHDTASLTGGVSPTGKITFTAYSDAQCTVSVFSTDVTVNGNGSYGPVGFTPAAVGTYHWIASYGGDAKNNPIAGACGDAGENDTVIKASPSIATLATDGGVAGDKISDTATLSGAHLPTSGTVTFNLYSATDPGCGDTPIFTSTVPIGAAGTATSDPFTVTLAGTYHWIASYSGDASNEAVAGKCGDDGETTVISKFNPDITTSLSSGNVTGAKITILFGATVTDQATLTGASPTAGGSVTYTVYNDNKCTDKFADAGMKTVVNGIAGASDPVDFPNAGTYYWQASYSGDVNNAPATSNCTDEVLTVTTPNIHAVKTVDGEHVTSANPGDVLHYAITVTNSGDAAGTADVTDDVSAILAHATIGAISDGGTLTAGVITWPQFTLAALNGSKTLTFEATLNTSFPDGTTHLPNAVVVIGTGSNCTPSAEQNADCKTDTTVDTFSLVIDKTNDAPLEDLVLPDQTVVKLPTADEGSTVTYTLSYTVGKLHVTNGIITDVVPQGLQYVDGSATSNAEFTFSGYDSTTRTLSWLAATVTENGSVTYKALVLKGASELAQPLTNVASIDSDQTPPDDAHSDVFVPVVPLQETAPPTDVIAHHDGQSTPGFSLMLILAVLGGIILTIGFITPVPEAVRRRNRR